MKRASTGSLVIAAALLSSVSAPAMADGVAPTKAAVDPKAPDAVRCVKLAITGSLVRKQRICKTNAEWVAIREQQSRDANDIMERNRTGTNTQ